MRLLTISVLLIFYLNLAIGQNLKVISKKSYDKSSTTSEFEASKKAASLFHQTTSLALKKGEENAVAEKKRWTTKIKSKFHPYDENGEESTSTTQKLLSDVNIKQIVPDDRPLNMEDNALKDILISNNDLTISNIYPNPVKEAGFIDYVIKNKLVKATILVHNVLGSIISKFDLSPDDTKIKIDAENLNPGIYFYTLDIDQKHVITKKFVKKR